MCCKASFVVGEISANIGFGKAKRVAKQNAWQSKTRGKAKRVTKQNAHQPRGLTAPITIARHNPFYARGFQHGGSNAASCAIFVKGNC
jgi:hypothetical protein